ncbi:MAG: hypothetical protein IJV48_06480 [Ruminococcus sp.]|nr:hypothetical protein [Ruminococcus sp.]
MCNTTSKEYAVEVSAYSNAKDDGAVSTDYFRTLEEAEKYKVKILGTEVYDDGATIDCVIIQEGYFDNATDIFEAL